MSPTTAMIESHFYRMLLTLTETLPADANMDEKITLVAPFRGLMVRLTIGDDEVPPAELNAREASVYRYCSEAIGQAGHRLQNKELYEGYCRAVERIGWSTFVQVLANLCHHHRLLVNDRDKKGYGLANAV